jgi:hypothetical protein
MLITAWLPSLPSDNYRAGERPRSTDVEVPRGETQKNSLYKRPPSDGSDDLLESIKGGFAIVVSGQHRAIRVTSGTRQVL